MASKRPAKQVRRLLDALGFGDQSLRQSKIFNDTLRAFRREYQSTNGTAGVDLRYWKLEQEELQTMANTFIAVHGQSFWPDIHLAESKYVAII